MTWPRFPVPTASERLLIAAAVARAPRAAAAWDEWFADVVLEDVPYHEARVLPQVFTNLLAQGEAERLPPRLRGKYRWVWASNQLRVDGVAPALRALLDAGVPVMALKGAAMLASGIAAWGAREMGDVDVLVPPARLGDAARALEAAGWRGSHGVDADLLVDRIRDRRHSWNFERGRHEQLDLHWHVLGARPDPAVARDYAAHARPLPLGPVVVDVPDPVGILLHVVEHASRGEPALHVAWVVDAARCLAGLDDAGVDALVERARSAGLTEVLAEAGDVLAGALDGPAGETAARVAARARRRGATWRERGLRWCREPHVGGRALPRTAELANALLLRGGTWRDLAPAAATVARRRVEPRQWRSPWTGYAVVGLRPPRVLRAAVLRALGPLARPTRLAPVEPGAWVPIGDGTALDTVAGRGWAWPYEGAVWAEGSEARLVLDVDVPPGRDLLLELQFDPEGDHGGSRWIRVLVNERPFVDWDAEFSFGSRHAWLEIPAWLADWCRPMEVTFRPLDPFRPAARRDPDDLRGFLALRAIRISPLP